MALLKYGHRQRAPYLTDADIPALNAGILLAQQFGKDWYVNSGAASGGNGASPDGAFTTLAAALAVAASGDRVYVAPGHAETLSSASAVTWSQSGITVIGLGVGASRPTFTWSTTDATFVMSGANNVLSNVRCVVSTDEVVSLFTVSGARNVLDRVDFIETTSKQALSFGTVTGADNTIQNCRHVQATAAASAQSWIVLTGADRFQLLGNTFLLTLADQATSAVARVVTTACLNVVFANNLIKLTGYTANLVSAFISLNTTTGLVSSNYIGADVAANTTINDMPGCYSFQNLCTNAVDKSGILDPVADT